MLPAGQGSLQPVKSTTHGDSPSGCYSLAVKGPKPLQAADRRTQSRREVFSQASALSLKAMEIALPKWGKG